MVYPAENMDFQALSKEQLKQLENQETDTASVIEVNDLRVMIGDQIARAEGDRVINRTDADRLRLGLMKSEKDKQEVFRVGSEVTKVIEESKRLMSSIDDKEELELFKEMSLEEKRRYVAGLRSQAVKLNERADKLASMLPAGAKEKLSALEGAERAKYIEELNAWRENVAKYGGMLGKYEKHFSRESLDQFMEQFKERSLSGQKEWLEKFEDLEGRPRAELTKRYEALPSEYRGRIRDFYNLRHSEKKAEVEKAREEFDFDATIEGEIGKTQGANYMSQADRKAAKDAFRAAPASMRKDMKSKIRDFVAAEAKLGKRFESLTKDEQADLQKRFGDFRELDYGKKEKALEEAEGGSVNLNKHYAEKLAKEKSERVIGEGTHKSYMEWFMKQSPADRRNALKTEVFDVREMHPRRMLKQRFEKELPAEVRKANERFYDLSGHERMELFEKLKREEEAKTAKPVAEAETVRKKAATKEDVAAGPADGPEKGAADAEIKDEIERAKNESRTMKDRIRNKTIAEGLAGLAASSDMVNQGKHESAKKDHHLHGEKERRLNEELVEFTDGKMVADTGRRKARNVNEVDLSRLGTKEMTEDQILKQKDIVAGNIGDKAQNVFETQIVDKASGRKLTGAMAKEQVRRQDEALKKDIAAKVSAGLEAKGRGGVKDREKIKARVEKEKFKVELKLS